uniref:non-specific serine/threonine protein kinase n=1 Tax=Populus trichocarpa TaxID=3694 RepID=A0A3N7FIK9_POPTR|eukprot:XP_024464221.1 CDPK-related kinase 5 isoform X3 [Populus trichocarpa]
MGTCTSKPPKPNLNAPKDINPPPQTPSQNEHPTTQTRTAKSPLTPLPNSKASPFFPFYTPSPFKKTPFNPTASTPLRFFKKSLAPPSLAKYFKAVLRRQNKKEKSGVEPNSEEGDKNEEAVELDKRFGFSKEFTSRLEVGEEVGRGHYGYTCSAKFKKGARKGQQVAVKVIPKPKMTTAIAVEDVRREVRILRGLTGHNNVVHFYDAFEDLDNVYIVMELCKGGELLDRILSRGGKYSEDDAKAVMVQILNVIAFCHLQGVVHRDLNLENFLYTSKEENSKLKVIDFGLSDFARPDERLDDIVGSICYVAPEVLHRSYSFEADVWSIGVIAYILLCGSRPFWARTESGLFLEILKADPSFDEAPWLALSLEAKDFVKRLLNKDPRKRITAAQALSHPWIRDFNGVKVPLDILIFKHMKAYMRSSSLRKAALKALSKTLTVDELFYLKEQFASLEPNESGSITLENLRMVLMKNATNAMKDSRIPDFLSSLNPFQHGRIDFEEFCAAALNVHQLEAHDQWKQLARSAYELFEKDGNRALVIEELASDSIEFVGCQGYLN